MPDACTKTAAAELPPELSAGQPGLPHKWQTDVNLLAAFYAANGLGKKSRAQAVKLIVSTGSIGAALSCPPTRLQSIGVSQTEAKMLHLLRTTVSLALRRPVEERPLLDTLSRVVDYLHLEMAYQRSESFRVLFMNGHLRLVHDEVMGLGSIASVEVHPRTIMVKALEVNAQKLLLVHNHPSGDPTPSREDVQITARIKDAGRMLGIAVLDHIVIAETGHASLRSLGLM